MLVKSGVIDGITGRPVSVESVESGGPFKVHGLQEVTAAETRCRVRSAMIENDVSPSNMSVTVVPTCTNSVLDLSIAVSMLGKQVDEDTFFFGELSLSGEIRTIRGILPLVVMAKEQGATSVVVPADNAEEANLAGGVDVLPVRSLREVIDYLSGNPLPLWVPVVKHKNNYSPDMSDVQGHEFAKRAMEIAAAGNHHLLFIGPPGSGKTMLARRMNGILPAMTERELLEVTAIHSIAGLYQKWVIDERPFRAPHHTISDIGLSGGGSPIRAGEASLAHNGVLFLDELLEFRRSTLETLRRPLDEGVVRFFNRGQNYELPAKFRMIGSMYSCPCGFSGSKRHCVCKQHQMEGYRSRVKWIHDLCDIRVQVPMIDIKNDGGNGGGCGDTSATIRERVENAIRFGDQLPSSEPDMDLLGNTIDTTNLSTADCFQIMSVARTIANLEGSEKVNSSHITESVRYR